MCAMLACTLRERKAAEQRREQQYSHSLRSRKKLLEDCKREKRHKKKRVAELLELLDLKGIEGKIIRSAWDYVPKSHNLDRQLVGLLRHMFVEYPVPRFLYRCCIRNADPQDPFLPAWPQYRQWFVALAQGESFTKLVKWLMTAREAHAFQSAPPNRRVHENVWWAKMMVAGMPVNVAERLVNRVFDSFLQDRENRLAETVQFFARHHAEMDRATFDEVSDFVAWRLRNDPGFRMRGRTVSSLIRLSEEWHVQVQKSRLDRFVEWPGLGQPDWNHASGETFWTVTELRNNRDLLREGRKQKHCVYTYVARCESRISFIFSLRGYPRMACASTETEIVRFDPAFESTRITVEVDSDRELVQIRGRLNRMATDEEMKVLRRWSADRGLTLTV